MLKRYARVETSFYEASRDSLCLEVTKELSETQQMVEADGKDSSSEEPTFSKKSSASEKCRTLQSKLVVLCKKSRRGQ